MRMTPFSTLKKEIEPVLWIRKVLGLQSVIIRKDRDPIIKQKSKKNNDF